MLDRFTDWHIRPQQIRPQIKNLDDLTRIKIEIEVEWQGTRGDCRTPAGGG
jgi:hypothetical protein